MYNSDGYILIDFTGVDITKSNQYLKGIYNRIVSVIDTNKLALVINAGTLSPMASIVRKTFNYYVITTNLYIFTINTNDIIVIQEAGESTVDVSIVPSLLEGVKIADFTIGATEGSIYAPEQQSEINDNVTGSNTTWSSDKLSTELASKANIASLSTVATTGDYDDLLDKPSIPSKTSDLTNDSGFITSAQVPTIDDNTVASDKVWSSYKTSAEIGTKANSNDVYTITEVDTALSRKANSNDVYTITEVDTALSGKQDNIVESDTVVTLASNAYVQPFTTYAEINVTSSLTNNRLLGILLLGSSTTNPVTYSYNNGFVRVYGTKTESITVRLLLSRQSNN
jgi:hypothetical protein